MSLVRPAAGLPEGVAAVEVDVFDAGAVTRGRDLLTMEEPLEIRLLHGPNGERVERSLAVTMRTPGDDVSLALGFLHGEGVIATMDDVIRAEVAAVPTSRPVVVVTNDQAVRRDVSAAGANLISSDAFLALTRPT